MADEAKTVTEIVIYRIRPDRREDFWRVRGRIATELRRFPGFVALRTEQHVDDATVICDFCEWRSKEEALDAFARFGELPSGAAFMECFAGHRIYAGHFWSQRE